MAVTATRNTQYRESTTPRKIRAVVDAGTTVYQGTMLNYDTTSGYVVNGTNAASRRFAGVYMGPTLAAPAVDTTIELHLDGEFLFAATAITALMHGGAMYMVDNETFDDTVGNGICVGVLRQWVSNTSGWLDVSVAAQQTANATTIVFADGGAYTHVAALAAVNADAALEELNLEIDTHIISDGAAGTQDPGTNSEHCARAVVGWGSGIAYQVIDSGAGLAADSVSCPNGFTTPKADQIQSVGTTGAPPANLYHPTAIVGGAQGHGFKYFITEDSTLNTAGSAAQAAIYRSATGTLTLTKLTGANQNQVVGRVLTVDATGDICIDFDDWNFPEHSHTDESEGGEIGGVKSFIITETWVKDGADKAIVTVPAFELPYAVTVKRCYGAVDTASGGVGTLTVDLNTTLCCTFTAAVTQAEDEALTIAIAANTDWAIVVNETAGGLCDNLKLDFYYTKDAI